MVLGVQMIRLWIEGAESTEAEIHRVSYIEGLSELSELQMLVALPEGQARSLVPGAKIKVSMSRDVLGQTGEPRFVHGIARTIEYLDQGDGQDLTRPFVRITVVPRVWVTGLQTRSRTFVDCSIDDVIGQTLRDHNLSIDGTASTGVHKLIVQYQESDQALMFRLLEDIGVSHYVRHDSSQDVWTLFNADPARTRSGEPRPITWATLSTGQADDAAILGAGRFQEMVTKTFAASDIDRRVETTTWSGTGARKGAPVKHERREPWRVTGDSSSAQAMRAADEHHAGHERVWLETDDIHLTAGERVSAELSQADAMNGVSTELLVVRVIHEFNLQSKEDVYKNRAEAVSFKTPYRPARLSPRPVITAPQTGVVRSYSEEKQLEVRVEMDWGAANPCVLPVRMTQPLAGANHGAVLLPHVNSEVLVHFIDGVPERPVLIGALYHKAAQSAVPGGAANHEHSFLSHLGLLGKRGPTSTLDIDDSTQDSETIKAFAINDVAVEIGRNEQTLVNGTSREEVKGNVTVELGAKRDTHITADEVYKADSNVSITVQKTGRVLVNQTLQMTADTKLSLISGNTRADITPSAVKITASGNTIEIGPSGIKLTVGGSVVELSAAQVKIGSTIVDINNGGLTVM